MNVLSKNVLAMNEPSNNRHSHCEPSNSRPARHNRCIGLVPRWLVPAILAASLGLGATMAPAPVQAQDSLARVLVDIADVVFRSGTPYYRQGDYRNDDRLVVGRDRYGRTVYYRVVPRDYRHDDRSRYRNGAPYGDAHGYYRTRSGHRYGHNHGDRDDDDHDRGRRWRDHDDDDDDDD